MKYNNPECIECGLLKSTTEAVTSPLCSRAKLVGGSHDFGTPFSEPTPPRRWEKDIELLREEFEELFPKDQEAIDGIRPSKSNRSAGLVLWAKWHSILKKALQKEREEIVKNTVGEIGAKLLAKHSPQAILDAYFDAANEVLEQHETNN